MDRLKFILLISIVGLFLVSLVLFLRGGSVAYDPIRFIDSLPHGVDMQVSGVKFTELNRSQSHWTLEASTLDYLQSEDLMLFDRVRATFFSDDGPLHISSDQGFYYRQFQKVRLSGNVRAKDAQGNHLVTFELTYDINTRVITAPGPFELTGPRMHLTGKGLVVDTARNRFLVQGRPTLILKSTARYL